MGEIKKIAAKVGEAAALVPGIYSLWLEEIDFVKDAVPGQFISVYCEDKSRLLPRPISICEIDRKGGRLRIVYRTAGAGTMELSRRKPGERVMVMGSLGNGYRMDVIKNQEEAHSLLIGGGIGIPPLLALAQALPGKKTAVLGYRDNQIFLKEEFLSCGCEIAIATDDGSVGTKGNVIDAIRKGNLQGDQIFACGPTPMQRGVKAYAAENKIPAQLSLEERMACGIGACLGCVCKSTEIDAHSHVHNKRVCKDGPVFFAEEIEL